MKKASQLGANINELSIAKFKSSKELQEEEEEKNKRL